MICKNHVTNSHSNDKRDSRDCFCAQPPPAFIQRDAVCLDWRANHIWSDRIHLHGDHLLAIQFDRRANTPSPKPRATGPRTMATSPSVDGSANVAPCR